MAQFAKYVPILAKLEGYGVFTNRPSDKGGATMSGVTLKTYRAYYGSGKTVDDLKAMTHEQWQHVMKNGYWDKVKGDMLSNQFLANIWADFAVNCGPTTAIKTVQDLLGETADGIFGPYTLRAVQHAPVRLLWAAIREARENYYRRLAAKDPSQQANLQGWLNRLRQFTYDMSL